MLNLEPIPFGGLSKLDADELVPIDRATTLTDAFIDKGIIEPRWGYRDVMGAIGSGGETPQHIGRMRVSPTVAYTVSVQGGVIRLIADPSTQTASDGSVAYTPAGTPFAEGDVVSGAMLNKDYYLAASASRIATRIRGSDFTLETLGGLPAPAQPGSAVGSYAWKKYRALVEAATWTRTAVGCEKSTTASNLHTDWYAIVGTTGDASQPAQDSTFIVDMGVSGVTDLRGADWIAFGISPVDNYQGGVHVKIAISADNTNYYDIGDTYDTPGGGGSDNLIFCKLDSVNDTAKATWRYVRFTMHNDTTQSRTQWLLYGHMPIYGRRLPQPAQYYVSVYDESTLQESPLSPVKEVLVPNDSAKLPVYGDAWVDKSFQQTNGNLDPLSSLNPRVFNRKVGTPMPTVETIGLPVTISGNAPTGYSGTKSIRLWVNTSSGVRLVTKATGISAGGAYSLIDNGSTGVAANERYKPNGTLPYCVAMGTFAGRLLAGGDPTKPNRLYMSSFTPTSDTSNGGVTTRPIPKWPEIPEEPSDGWSLDIISSYDDQILGICGDNMGADAAYILTAKGVWVLLDVDAPPIGVSPQVYHPLTKGTLGRSSFCYDDDSLFVASVDGCYQITGRVRWSELTEDQRVLWEEFAPSVATIVRYQKRKLYVIDGTRFLRYDFVRREWTGPHTIADTVLFAATWRDVGKTVEEMWLYTSGRKMARYQSTCLRDMQVGTDTSTGTAVRPWVYETGYAFAPSQARVRTIMLDIQTGQVELSVHNDAQDAKGKPKTFRAGVHTHKLGADAVGHYFRNRYKGIGSAKLRRVLWDHQPLDSIGPEKVIAR